MGARFSAPVQTGPGAHPASCTMGIGSFLGVKAVGLITLLNVAYKIFTIILNQSLVDIVETKLGDSQSGFRPNRSIIDNIFMIRQIIEKCYEYNVDIHNIRGTFLK